jgi:predicted MFS family arabinose efflux permease
MGLLSLSFAAALALGPWLGVLTYAEAGPRAVWLATFVIAVASGLLLARFRTPGAAHHR